MQSTRVELQKRSVGQRVIAAACRIEDIGLLHTEGLQLHAEKGGGAVASSGAAVCARRIRGGAAVWVGLLRVDYS